MGTVEGEFPGRRRGPPERRGSPNPELHPGFIIWRRCQPRPRLSTAQLDDRPSSVYEEQHGHCFVCPLATVVYRPHWHVVARASLALAVSWSRLSCTADFYSQSTKGRPQGARSTYALPMDAEIYPPQTVARVKHVSEDQTTAFLELRNGNIATCTSPEGFNLNRGDIVFIDVENSDINFAPNELWDEDPWVGVVRLLLPGQVVIDIGGRLKVLDEPLDVDLREGNTVKGLESRGIVEVISEDPVRYIDLPAVDSVTVEQFKISPDGALTFDDFGGYSEIVNRAKELIEIPLEHHDALKKIGARPIKGVLFTGPPGTGKTMLAKIIANRANAEFYEISGPEVLSKWYGQSEELIRKIFEDAATQERAIVFFDEMDSLASQRSEDTHEASRRIVGQLLSAMDGFTADTNVVVIATTNRPQDLDAALRRPGRFDWEINFPMPSLEDRRQILEASAKRLNKGQDLPHPYIAEKTAGWSPAELAAIWSEAALLAVAESRDAIFADDYICGYERVALHRINLSKSPGRQERANDVYSD